MSPNAIWPFMENSYPNSNHEPMRGGVLQSHGGRRGGVNRGRGDNQISGAANILVGRQLGGGIPEY